ncbi:hypothetical protein I3842_05G097100 [Carya illinoinensis]|uniref:C2H2-type domain-containing protein n=1 Tax=Carya illinoinensis TaxID=32201 RepID=A0A922EXR7_CARIL|nr:hypothetical protein I3842_05G097100 [Carya illinoinensis]
MSNFAPEFEDDEQFQSTIVSQSSTGNPPHAEKSGDGSTPSTVSKKKRHLPGNPGKQTFYISFSLNNPDAEVVALSPRTLMATNRYICEACHKGFQRDQNLQLHRRGQNLPWKLKQRTNTNCVHHDPSRTLGDLTGIKKHFCRKHGEKKWKCDRCSKRYAVQSDWKAHTKICGTREYRCDCGTIFSSFVTHRAFCDALTEENNRVNQKFAATGGMLQSHAQELFISSMPGSYSCSGTNTTMNLSISNENVDNSLKPLSSGSAGVMISSNLDPTLDPRTTRTCFSSEGGSNAYPMTIGSCYTSATALLQKAAEMGAKTSDNSFAPIILKGFNGYPISSRNSSGSVQVDREPYDKTLDPADHEPSYTISPSQTGLFHSPLSLHVENGYGPGHAGNLLRHVYIGEGEKMTVDFLGVESAGNSRAGKKRSYDGNVIGLEYSNAQQSVHSEWY